MNYQFTRIRLKNWKNFPDVDIPLTQRNFIVGPNAIGKSNLLDAFRFLRDVAIEGGGLAKAVEWRGGMTGVRSLHARKHPEVTIDIEIMDNNGEGYEYSLRFTKHPTQKRSHEPIVEEEKVDHIAADGSKTELLSRSFHKGEDVEAYTQTHLQQVAANKDFRSLADFLRSTSYLHIVPQLLREQQPPVHYGSSPDQFGRDLLDRIRHTHTRSRNSRLHKIGEILKSVVPQMKNLEFEIDDDGRPRLKVKFDHWRAYGASQYETQLSDGTLRLIGLLWAVQEKEGALLLEEPELSLHGEIVGKLAYFIYKSQKQHRRQVILSTHSERMLQDEGIAPEEVILIRPGREGSEVISAAQIDEVSDLMQSGFSAEEAILPRTKTEAMDLFDKVEP